MLNNIKEAIEDAENMTEINLTGFAKITVDKPRSLNIRQDGIGIISVSKEMAERFGPEIEREEYMYLNTGQEIMVFYKPTGGEKET